MAVRDATSMDASTTLRRIETLLDHVRAVDTRRYETRATNSILREHVPEIEKLLASTFATLEAIAERYAASAEKPGLPDDALDGDFAAHVDALMQAEDAASRVADIAVVARMELAHRHLRLQQMPLGADSWDYIAVTSSIRRRVLKSVTAIQTAIRRHEGLNDEDSWFRSELDHSLEVRRVYAAFRRRLQLDRPPSRAEMYTRLRLVGTSIAILVGKDIYEHLRVTDRQMIRALQAKVINWLRKDPTTSGRFPARAGEHIWQDVAACADLLMQVNHRTELRDHDVAALEALADALRRNAPPAECRVRLAALEGADEKLDQFIRSSDEPTDALTKLVPRLLAGTRRPTW